VYNCDDQSSFSAVQIYDLSYIHLCCTFSLFSNTEHHIQKWLMHIKQVFLYSRSKRKNIPSCSSRHFVFFVIKTSCKI